MTDIGTSVALDALRSGRTTRMTDQMALTEQRIEMLAATLADTRRRRQDAEAFVARQQDFETFLTELIERERTSPTPIDSPTGSMNGGEPVEHGVGATLSGTRAATPPPDGGDKPPFDDGGVIPPTWPVQ